MQFDFGSFAIGFASASVLAFVLYRMRGFFGRIRQSAETQAAAARSYFTNTADQRYLTRLRDILNESHVAGDLVPLTAIYTEPRFTPPNELRDPGEEEIPSIGHVVPQFYEFPYAYAPYNINTISLDDLRKGERRLAIIGLPGSGKTTALAIIGLCAIGEIDPITIDLMVDEVFEREIAGKGEEERERMMRQYHDNQRRAIERLRDAQGVKEEDIKQAVDFRSFFPIYFHLRDIDLRPEAHGIVPAEGKPKSATKPLDPAEPLVRALQKRFGGSAASTLPRLVYSRLAQGRCLVLIDGLDDLSPSQRDEKFTWLKQFMGIYGANFVIIASPVTGYDPLINLGFLPLGLRAWDDNDIKRVVDRWAAQWPNIKRQGRRAAQPLDPKQIERVKLNTRGRSPMDITFKLWADFSGDLREQGRRGYYDFFIRRHLDNEALRPILAKAAATQLESNGAPILRDTFKEYMTTAFTGADGKLTLNVDDALNKLLNRTNLLIDAPGGGYVFIHPLIGAYLASESLDPTLLVNVATKPIWSDALAFAASRLPMDSAAAAVLEQPADLLYHNVFSLTYWLPDAPQDAKWRGEYFRRLGVAGLLAPSQFPLIRERAMAALVCTRDRNIVAIFHKALEHPDPLVRQLGCIGLGAVGDPENIQYLDQMLSDDVLRVRLAAGFALGAIGTDAAIDSLTESLLRQEDRDMQRAVAEALAAIPGEGHNVLREAVNNPDLTLRRAAVFGLARIKAGWALAQLYRSSLEDSEGYVRMAADQAFKSAERPDAGGVSAYPPIDQFEWLVHWMGERGDVVPTGENAANALLMALQEGDPAVRGAAARTLGELRLARRAIKPLYRRLSDEDESVRAEAYTALGQLEQRIGEKLPAAL
ncbi:MAG: hypothetical protein OHK0023_07510 [Anaerolineae bacterium]